MAKVTVYNPYEDLLYKPKRGSGFYVRTDPRTGRKSLVRLTKSRSSKASPKEEAARMRFASMQRAVSSFMRQGKSDVENGIVSDAAKKYLMAQKAFAGQTEKTTLKGFIISRFCRYDAETGVAVVEITK